MKKTIITIAAVIVGFTILAGTLNLFEAFLMFLLAGAIPGTPYVVAPGIMFGGIVLVGCLLIARFVADSLSLLIFGDRRLLEALPQPKKALPKRRYSRI